MSSHINETGMPHMIDVGVKDPTRRRAVASGIVTVPAGGVLVGEEWHSPKGPVFQTAIIAGIQGAKATSGLIPLCHPLPITRCGITIQPVNTDEGKGTENARAVDQTIRLEVVCTVETTARTGVEMEALTGVSIACLTVYDMGKSVTHGIVIGPIRLLEKTGGKRDRKWQEAAED